ncbi:hypothetical protein GCM10008983_10180 [Lentibacillus halophilus]|uniref:YfhE-like protein n=1 Tax=Lentibacillus halophilus TaxID=295065 RepID=A0ABN0Z674_9BACI
MAATSAKKTYTLDRNQAKIIANASKVNVEKPSYEGSFHLSPEERQKKAEGILNKWKRH